MQKLSFLLKIVALGLCIAAGTKQTKAQDVYVGGWSNNRAVVWKNGTPNHLTPGNGFVSSVFVVGEDVYTAGYESGTGENVAKVWKNGVVLYSLTDGTYRANANAVAVSGSDVYVAGNENSSGSIGKLWKNGVAEAGYSDAWLLYSISIEGSDVYVAGISLTFKAAVWKNGTLLYTLTPGAGNHAAYSTVVVDGDVYTVGHEQTGEWGENCVQKVWKNNTALYTLGTFTNFKYPSIMGICISDGIIYVVGDGINGAGIRVAKLWTNGAGTDLSDGTIDAFAYSVFASGKDIYVAGTENYGKALLWKNGTSTTLSSGSSEGAYSVFVVNKGVGVAETHCNASVRVYPNPTNNQLIIENGELTIENYSIYSVVGQVVQQGQLHNNTINVESLAAGMYFLKIDGKTVKFVKE